MGELCFKYFKDSLNNFPDLYRGVSAHSYAVSVETVTGCMRFNSCYLDKFGQSINGDAPSALDVRSIPLRQK
jgi:hypothetical protein